MAYTVKEAFLTLQGEGAQTGRAAVFCRFAGCNLWSGREADRVSAVCTFCDTDFVGTDGAGGGRFETAEDLARHLQQFWSASPDPQARPLVVLTGGEPSLQVDAALVGALKRVGFELAMETNGTRGVADGVDWITVSPKASSALVQTSGNELKLVFPQVDAPPVRFESLEFKHFFLQPMDGPDREANTRAAIEYCLAHPRWRLSVQVHKNLGIR